MKRLHVHVAVEDLPQSIDFTLRCSLSNLPWSRPITPSGC